MDDAQRQIDTRALELAAIATERTERTLDSLNRHIDSCASMQRRLFIGVISLLVMMLGVLLNLYVLPHPH